MCDITTRVDRKKPYLGYEVVKCPNGAKYWVTFWRWTSLSEEVLTVWRMCEEHLEECKKVTRYISHEEIK